MLSDRGHSETGRQQIQPTDTLLEGWAHGRFSGVTTIGHTGDAASQLRSFDEARKRWAWNACIFGDLGLLRSSKHLFHGPQIPVKLLEYGLGKTGGIERRPWNEGNRHA